MSEEIVISASPPKPIAVDLLGTKYKVRPIKGSLAVSLGQRLGGKDATPEKIEKEMGNIVTMIFGKQTATEVKKRLADPEDLLDYPHIMELVKAIAEAASGNPTT